MTTASQSNEKPGGAAGRESVTAQAQPGRPNLFIVGAAKCGTTSLHAYLAQHPQICMSSNKEPHYFGSDLNIDPQWRPRDEQHYLSLYQHKPDTPIIGEASTWYLYSEKAAQEIKAFNPDARIIIMLRQPADFINSLHLQLINGANEDMLDINQALAAEPDRARNLRIPETCRFKDALQYRRAARFSEQVGRYLEIFGRDRVGIWLLEDMAQDTGKLLQEVFAFLGVNPDVTIDATRENTTRSLTRFDLYLKNMFYRSTAFRRLVLKTPKPILNLYRRTTTKLMPTIRDKGFDPELRARLTAEYEAEIDSLALLINRDLEHWKQPNA